MNRKHKIIISITGIVIITLALIGVTYGYFLTRVSGNTNDNSILLTTANLRLVYSDGTGEINAVNIQPGSTVYTKTFTVTNEGNATIEYEVYLENVINKFVHEEDLLMFITCESNIEGNTCNGYGDGTISDNKPTFGTSIYPTINSKLITNSIDPVTDSSVKEVHTYTLYLMFKDDGTDQSDDMGKTLQGKIQIYDPKDVVAITGVVTGYDSTNYVEMHSEVKTSEIASDGSYIIYGVGAEEHTIYIKSSTSTEDTEVGSSSIKVTKGTESSITSDASSIVISELTEQVTVNITNIDSTNKTLTLEGKDVVEKSLSDNPFKKDTLAYNIYENAITNKNGTIYSETPLTTPAKEISSVTSYNTTGEEATYVNTMYSGSYASNTWYYYDTYEVDETTGEFTLSGKHSCTYNSCYANLVGKYLYSTSVSSNSTASNHTADTITNLSNVYKVTETTSSTLKYVTIFNSPNEAERVLATTTDDYGTSYYYRGIVEDNYVNFAGMCWRIVRIEGDGSVKLILEDKAYECDNASFTGNWSDGNTYEFGYDSNSRIDFLNYSGGLADSFKTFQTSLSSKISSVYTGETIENKLKIDEWCYDDTIVDTSDYGEEEYGAHTRIYTNKVPSLKCAGTKLTKFSDDTNMYVATLTADEIAFAGAKYSSVYTDSYNYYLMNNYSKYMSKGLHFWSLSPNYNSEGDGYDYYYIAPSDVVFYLNYSGVLRNSGVAGELSSRPAITLKAGSMIKEGEGTIESPYVIE